MTKRLKGLIDRLGDDAMNPIAQGIDILFGHSFGIDSIVDVDGDRRWMEHPAAFPVELVRPDDTHGNDGVSQLDGHGKHPSFEGADASVPGARPFGEHDEAHIFGERSLDSSHHVP